jgi:hypothetical protein
MQISKQSMSKATITKIIQEGVLIECWDITNGKPNLKSVTAFDNKIAINKLVKFNSS